MRHCVRAGRSRVKAGYVFFFRKKKAGDVQSRARGRGRRVVARTSVQKLIDRPHVLAPRRPLSAGPAHRQLSAAGTALRRLVQATSELPGRAGVSSRGLGQIWAGPMVLARRPSFQQCLPLKKKKNLSEQCLHIARRQPAQLNGTTRVSSRYPAAPQSLHNPGLNE